MKKFDKDIAWTANATMATVWITIELAKVDFTEHPYVSIGASLLSFIGAYISLWWLKIIFTKKENGDD